MIRRVVAWSLVTLALSPFTAPFSTCALSVLFSHRAPYARLVIQGLSTDASIDVEALSVSPVVQRTTLKRPFLSVQPTAAPLIAVPLVASVPPGGTGVYESRQTPQEYFAQPTVLRL